MLMDQVRQLQQQVSELSSQKPNNAQQSQHSGPGPTSGFGGPTSGYAEQFPPRILLVSNIPNSVASCDALFFMFDRSKI